MELLLETDDLHHAQIDGDEAPELPEKKCAHEEREARWLGGVDVGVDSIIFGLVHARSPWRICGGYSGMMRQPGLSRAL